ncbi:hypothetical protein Aab01nite_00940 [Paractinoplanes abujensis]|uniref:Uncharacterized protein n=1 Tax=Paractinoplanes abujensis TaxID=882441 RepID=A0A7W7G2X3_9ACTN|nr:hypothetical protein [Actinoplanes abujensis]MBB4692081.1 hypothetical protein [Actinoplanes abujensis]GID16504.1 hypothetical protein Aab01nite_00940 [Actinoplanes abujensis]
MPVTVDPAPARTGGTGPSGRLTVAGVSRAAWAVVVLALRPRLTGARDRRPVAGPEAHRPGSGAAVTAGAGTS